MEPLPVFRAPKRRRFTKPLQAERPSSAPPLTQADNNEPSSDEERSGGEADANVSLLRRPTKHPKAGVSFTSNVRASDEGSHDLALMPADTSSERLKNMANRFIGTTGQVVDVDKHMYGLSSSVSS